MYKLVAVLALAASVSAHDVIVGSNSTGKKIFDEKKIASPAMWRQTDTVTVKANNSEVISGVIITDLRPEKDGDAKVVEGGQGQKNVTVELKSPTVFRGYDFHIEVYTVPDENGQEVITAPKEDKVKENIPVSMVTDTVVNNNARAVRKTDNDSTTLKGLEAGKLPFDYPKFEDVNVTATVANQTNTAEDKNVEKDVKINIPVMIGKDQARQYRDTENKDINNRETTVNKSQYVPNVPYPSLVESNFGKSNETVTEDNNSRDTPKGHHEITPQLFIDTPIISATDKEYTTNVSEKNVTEHKQNNTTEKTVENDINQLNSTVATFPRTTESQGIKTVSDEGLNYNTPKSFQDNRNTKSLKH